MERFLGGALDDVLRGAGEEDACAPPLDRALGEHAGREVPHVDVLVFAPDGDVHHALPAQLAQVAVGQHLSPSTRTRRRNKNISMHNYFIKYHFRYINLIKKVYIYFISYFL